MLHLWLLSRLFSGHFLTSKSPSRGAGTRPGCSVPVMLPLVLQASLHRSRPFLLPFQTPSIFSPTSALAHRQGPRLGRLLGSPFGTTLHGRTRSGRMGTLHSEPAGVSPPANLFPSVFNIFHRFTHSIYGACVTPFPSQAPGWYFPLPHPTGLARSSPPQGGNHRAGCSFWVIFSPKFAASVSDLKNSLCAQSLLCFATTQAGLITAMTSARASAENVIPMKLLLSITLLT